MGLIKRTSIVDMSREDWLAERRKAIGGSDASAILRLNPYTTPYALWADKTGRLPDKEDNEAMRQGRDLEQYVVDRFSEVSGRRCRRVNAILTNTDYPYSSANIDREVVGESAGLECKTTSVLNLKKFRDGEFPDTYYCQCVHYLAVTQWTRWYLAVLVLNKGFMVYQLTRAENDEKPDWCESSVYVSDGEIRALMGAESAFWTRYVIPDIPPPADGLKPTSETISALYPVGGEKKVISLDCENTFRSYVARKQQIAALKVEQERFEQVLKKAMGAHERGECGKFTVTWKPSERRTFDHKKFEKENPDMDLSPYYKLSAYRRFEVKETA